MFNSKENQSQSVGQGSITAISAGTSIKGDLECSGDVRIDGTLIGNLTCESKIIVGPKGIVEGNIKGNTAEIMGQIKGNIIMTGQLNLQGKCVIEGDLHVAKLQIAPDVTFNGKCSMGLKSTTPKAALPTSVYESA